MFIDALEIEKARYDTLATKLSKPLDWYTNCGGFALAGKGWYYPGNYKNDDAWKRYHTKGKGKWRKLERHYVKCIMREFPELELMKREKVLNVDIDLSTYELIAFRIRRNPFFCDYHFMKCNENGDWLEKKGALPGIISHRYEEILDIWGEYDGKLYFFVRKRAK